MRDRLDAFDALWATSVREEVKTSFARRDFDAIDMIADQLIDELVSAASLLLIHDADDIDGNAQALLDRIAAKLRVQLMQTAGLVHEVSDEVGA